LKGPRDQDVSHPLPWVLAPGTNAQVQVTLNLAGKPLPVSSALTVSTERGDKLLIIRARAETVEHP